MAVQSRLPHLMRGRAAAVQALPEYHASGYTVTNRLISLGLDVLVVSDALDTALIVDLVDVHDPLVMFCVPTQFMEPADVGLDADVIGLSGSAPLAGETRARFGDRAKGRSQGYGLSALSPITHFDVAGIQRAVMGDAAADDAGLDRPTVGSPDPDRPGSERLTVVVEPRRQRRYYCRGCPLAPGEAGPAAGGA